MSEPTTLDMILKLIETNHTNIKEMITHQGNEIKEVKDEVKEVKKEIKEIKKTIAEPCVDCPDILVLKTRMGFQWLYITGIGLGLLGLANLGYNAQGKILEYIGNGGVR